METESAEIRSLPAIVLFLGVICRTGSSTSCNAQIVFFLATFGRMFQAGGRGVGRTIPNRCLGAISLTPVSN